MARWRFTLDPVAIRSHRDSWWLAAKGRKERVWLEAVVRLDGRGGGFCIQHQLHFASVDDDDNDDGLIRRRAERRQNHLRVRRNL